MDLLPQQYGTVSRRALGSPGGRCRIAAEWRRPPRRRPRGWVGCTVTAAWRVLRVSRWAVEAQRGHGSPGTPSVGRRPSVYHLVPRREARPVTHPAVHDFHLPPSGGVGLSPPVGNYSPSERASAPAHQISEDKPRPARRWRTTARPLATQRLAAALVASTHGLDRAHTGAICDALTAAGIDPRCGQPAPSPTR